MNRKEAINLKSFALLEEERESEISFGDPKSPNKPGRNRSI